MAIPFGPLPIGVATPPTAAARAIANKRARRNPSVAPGALSTGRTAPITSAAAATFDIHIARAAVVKATIVMSLRLSPRERRSACSTAQESSFHLRAAAASEKPHKNRRMTGSADHASTAGALKAGPESANTSGTATQSTIVAIQTGTHSVNQRTRQSAAMMPARAGDGQPRAIAAAEARTASAKTIATARRRDAPGGDEPGRRCSPLSDCFPRGDPIVHLGCNEARMKYQD